MPTIYEDTCPGPLVKKPNMCPNLLCGEGFFFSIMGSDRATAFFYYASVPIAVMMGILVLELWRHSREPLPIQAPVFCSFTRTFEQFAGHRFPVDAPGAIAYQQYFEHEKGHVGLRLLFRRGTAAESMVGVVGFMVAIVCLMILSLRSVILFGNIRVYHRLVQVLIHCGKIEKSLRLITSLTLIFYLLNRLRFWWGLQACGWRIQGRLHDIALSVGGAASAAHRGGDADAFMREKYRLYRHLMLAFFFLCKSTGSQVLQQLDDPELIESGLLTKEESEILKTPIKTKLAICEKWVSDWIGSNIPDGQQAVKIELIKQVDALRGVIAGTQDQLSVRAPYSFEGLIFVAIRLQCFFMACDAPGGLGEGSGAKDLSVRADILKGWAALMLLDDTIVMSFYLAIMEILRILKTPFESGRNPLDSLNPEAIMLSTERKLVEYLTAPLPASLGDKKP